MPNPLRDFVNADQRPSAFFEGDDVAAGIAREISKSQKRKFYRYKMVPSAFFVYLQKAGIIRKDHRIPKGGSTVDCLLDFLRFYPYESEQARSAGEFLFREIIKGKVPGLLNKAFGLSDHVWEKGNTYARRSSRQKENEEE